MHSQIYVLTTLASLLLVAASASAQQATTPSTPSVTSKTIAVSPVTGDDKKELVVLAITLQPGATVAMHTHPGDCVGSIVEGAVELLVEGREPTTVPAGEGYSNLRGTVHGFRNVGSTQAKLVNSFVVEKGMPRVQPVAAPAK